VYHIFFLPGCGAEYRSSCRKGREQTRSAALDGLKNSCATNSPEELLSWNRRGVKLNLPGSTKREKDNNKNTEKALFLKRKVVHVF